MTPILANTITADMGLIPGLAFVGPAMGLPLSVLASVIERPFYTAGGVKPHAIWYSLQANLISLAVGFVGVFVFLLVASAAGYGVSDMVFFVAWPVAAVATSIVVERAYIARRLGRRDVSWGWAAAANIVSAAVGVGILFAIGWLRAKHPALQAYVQPYAGGLKVFALVGSCIAFGFAFHATPNRMRVAALPLHNKRN